MQVLVHRNPRQELLRDRVLGVAPGVAVRNASRELLERHVRAHVEQRLVAGLVARLHRQHPSPLELVRVDAPRHQQVVADAERVPSLLRRPPVDPRAPRAVATEDPLHLAVIARQVVLCEQVDLERDPSERRQRRLLHRPRLAVEQREVAALAPRHVLVRHPLFGHLEMPVEVLGDRRLEVGEQAGRVECCCHHDGPFVGMTR